MTAAEMSTILRYLAGVRRHHLAVKDRPLGAPPADMEAIQQSFMIGMAYALTYPNRAHEFMDESLRRAAAMSGQRPEMVLASFLNATVGEIEAMLDRARRSGQPPPDEDVDRWFPIKEAPNGNRPFIG